MARRGRSPSKADRNAVIPAVTGPDQVVRSGIEGLRYLAGVAGTDGPVPCAIPLLAARRPTATLRLNFYYGN